MQAAVVLEQILALQPELEEMAAGQMEQIVELFLLEQPLI
jgi:hypothetical protein